MNKKGQLSFFDSYGYAPDSQFNFIPKDYFNQHYKERATDAGMLGFSQKSPLQYLIYKYLNENKGKKSFLDWNDRKLQAENTHTCGRWCAVRMLLRDYDSDKFIKMASTFKKDTKKIIKKLKLYPLIWPDLKITYVTHDL
jgi:hypothetical protein